MYPTSIMRRNSIAKFNHLKVFKTTFAWFTMTLTLRSVTIASTLVHNNYDTGAYIRSVSSIMKRSIRT